MQVPGLHPFSHQSLIGTVIGQDGETPVTTPYDDCVLIMPSRRLRQGESAVRFGRYIDAD